MRKVLAALLGFALVVPLAAADLSSRLDHIIDSAPALSAGWLDLIVEHALALHRVRLHAIVGAQVLRLSDGRVLYARNSERLFVPASNMKLFTTALALTRLGAEYRLRTQIGADSPVDAAGTLSGDLELMGGGDP